MDKDNTTQEMTLEQIFGRLDEITSSLEDASVGLEASFALYKEAVDRKDDGESKNRLVAVEKTVESPT